MDEHAKRYAAIAWFFIAYSVWSLTYMRVIYGMVIPYLVGNYERGHEDLSNALLASQASHVEFLFQLVRIAMRVGLGLAVVALAWLLRGDHVAGLKPAAR